MKSTPLVLALAIASLSFSALTFAQNNDRRGGRDEQFQQQGQRMADPRDQQRMEPRVSRREVRREDRRDERNFDQRRDHRMDYREAHQNERHGYYNARGPEFRRGGYVPREFRDRQYYVNDYRAHHLTPPPRGHQWVQVGADYVLIAIATGLIANMILSH